MRALAGGLSVDVSVSDAADRRQHFWVIVANINRQSRDVRKIGAGLLQSRLQVLEYLVELGCQIGANDAVGTKRNMSREKKELITGNEHGLRNPGNRRARWINSAHGGRVRMRGFVATMGQPAIG
jgi:hypothetical protein